jgi:hypothetical protein
MLMRISLIVFRNQPVTIKSVVGHDAAQIQYLTQCYNRIYIMNIYLLFPSLNNRGVKN